MSGFGFLEGSMGMVVWTGGLLILGFVLERILVLRLAKRLLI